MVHRRFAVLLFFALSLFACARPTSDRESVELGVTRQAASQPTGVDPTEAPTWPSDAQWIPLMKGSNALYDVVKDKSGSADVVGDETHASIYVYSDGTHLFWRLRVNANPAAGYPNFDNSGIWVCLINTDTDYGTYEWLTWVNGKGTVDTTEIWRNTSTSPSYYDSPSDSPDQFVSALNILNDANAHARVVNTANTFSPSTFATNSADADFFVDAAFDISSFAGTITSTTPLRLACGTSATSQGLNADFTSPSNATTLSALYSDPMTCGLTGCPVCNTANACGNSCTACSGTTPVCTGGACAACDGDYATGTANACSASQPYCAANGSCTTCASNADCTAGTATHGGQACVSGACTNTCVTDSQCATNQWCSMNKCVAKQANGTSMPFDVMHMPPVMGCTSASGATVCASGVCDSDIKCGYLDRTQTCASNTVCRSGICGAGSSLCQPAGGCSADGDCAAGQYCDGNALLCVAKLANGSPTVTDSIHTGTCPALGIECVSGVCSDGRCGCASDADCASTEFCLASTATCTAKLADGAATISDALHTTGCPDRGAAECQSGYCGMGSNLCIAAGACAADSDCASTMYCNGVTCMLKKPNGAATATDAIHTGSCPALGVECVSAVCDANDNLCGYALGSGTCDATNAATVCRTGVCATGGTCGCSADTDCASNQYCSSATRACTAKLDLGATCNSSNALQICLSGACGSASLACIPNTGSGCWTDGDCLGTQFCKADHSCTNKLANGTAIPNDAAHGGVCSGQNASAVCASGACDVTNDACGIGLEHATCASTDQCTAGVCVLSGDNAGRCEPCSNDTSCSGATPACNTTTNHCVACTATSHDLCTGNTPLCNASTNLCTGCSADHTAIATAGSCPSANAPFCTTAGACGKCTANRDCAGHASGAFCDLTTGACGAGCTIDADCASTEWCSNPAAQPVSGTCVSKLANDDLVPSALLVDGACTTDLGQRVCASGVCDSDARCGFANRTACDAASECRSTVCNLDRKCGDPNGTACLAAATCRSNECAIDGKCGKNNGETCLDDAACRTGSCVAGTCGLPNGQTCAASDPLACRSGICFVDLACGLPNGQACHAGNDCRSGSCYQGRCEPTCEHDAQCAKGFYCNAAASHCDDRFANGEACTRNAMCASGVCNADGKCGDPDGFACTWAVTCRNGSCIDDKCSAALDQGAPCKLDASCKSRICADDGRCGIPSGSSCSFPSQCRDGACDATGRCAVSCASDAECPADTWCNGSCVRDGLNGAACARNAACESGRCSAGQCGARNGEACSSNGECRSNACDPGTHRCGYENGNGPCTAATARTACLSGVCGADHKCGLPSNGPICETDEQCRGAACDVTRHTCNECKTDRECASSEFCGAGNCKLKLDNGLGCGRANECAADVCGGDMRCGEPDGEACTSTTVCRSGLCSNGLCGAPPAVTPPAPPKDAAAPAVAPSPAAPLPTPLSTVTPPSGGAAASADHAGDAETLQGGGGLSCASTPRSRSSGGLGLLAIAALALVRRRRR